MKLKIFLPIIFAIFLLFGCIGEPSSIDTTDNTTIEIDSINATPEVNQTIEIPSEEPGEFEVPDQPEQPEAPPPVVEPEPEPEPEELCITHEEYEEVTDPNAPVLSLPFDLEDYYTLHWGMVPFCIDLWGGTSVHGAIDFELKPNSKVYAAESGVVTSTYVGQQEGSGEVIEIQGDGFSIDYSGLTNIQFEVGDEVKKGDYMADVVQIPHGEYHIHMGIEIDGKYECPVKYMDEEFKEALKEMFSQAHYSGQSEAPCVCNCESITLDWE